MEPEGSVLIDKGTTRLIKAREEQRGQESRGARVLGVNACEGDRRGAVEPGSP